MPGILNKVNPAGVLDELKEKITDAVQHKLQVWWMRRLAQMCIATLNDIDSKNIGKYNQMLEILNDL